MFSVSQNTDNALSDKRLRKANSITLPPEDTYGLNYTIAMFGLNESIVNDIVCSLRQWLYISLSGIDFYHVTTLSDEESIKEYVDDKLSKQSVRQKDFMGAICVKEKYNSKNFEKYITENSGALFDGSNNMLEFIYVFNNEYISTLKDGSGVLITIEQFIELDEVKLLLFLLTATFDHDKEDIDKFIRLSKSKWIRKLGIFGDKNDLKDANESTLSNNKIDFPDCLPKCDKPLGRHQLTQMARNINFTFTPNETYKGVYGDSGEDTVAVNFDVTKLLKILGYGLTSTQDLDVYCPPCAAAGVGVVLSTVALLALFGF